MKKRIFLVFLLAFVLFACRFSAGPSVTSPQASQPADGTASTPTTPKTSANPDPASPPTLEQEFSIQDPIISDPNIGQAKFRLMELGYDICTISADFYTYQTEAAVRQFQTEVGLPADGVLDSATWGRLFQTDTLPSQGVAPSPLNAGDSFSVEAGDSFTVTPDAFWIFQGGYFSQFSRQNGEFLGFYQVEPLPGEEIYQPSAVVYDGEYLWIAQQGPEDAILQAYDPQTASPVEALLKPVFPQSIRFPSLQLYSAAAFDGQRLWFLTDDLQQQALLLQPFELRSRTAGGTIRLGMSSGTGYGYGITYDPHSEQLWISYTDEIFGEQAIVAVDPGSGEIGPTLGPCGMQVTYSMSLLWFVNQQGFWSFNPADGERRQYDLAVNGSIALAADPEYLWLMDANGTIVKVETP